MAESINREFTIGGNVRHLQVNKGFLTKNNKAVGKLISVYFFNKAR
jgi:hypothetical protein